MATVGRQYKPVLKDNLSNGDCFFSAIFRAARSSGVLEQIAGCMNFNTTTEDAFITGAREFVVKLVGVGQADSYYERYNELFNTEPETLEAVIESESQYVQKLIKNKLKQRQKNPATQFYTKKEYFNEVAANILTRGTWVGQLETSLMRTALSKCQIELKLLNTPLTGLVKREGHYEGEVFLYLLNEDEVHWKHYVLVPTGGKRRKTLKKKNSRRVTKRNRH